MRGGGPAGRDVGPDLAAQVLDGAGGGLRYAVRPTRAHRRQPAASAAAEYRVFTY